MGLQSPRATKIQHQTLDQPNGSQFHYHLRRLVGNQHTSHSVNPALELVTNGPERLEPPHHASRTLRPARQSSSSNRDRSAHNLSLQHQETSARKCLKSPSVGFKLRAPFPSLFSLPHRAVPKHSPALPTLAPSRLNPSFDLRWLAAAIVQSAKSLAI